MAEVRGSSPLSSIDRTNEAAVLACGAPLHFKLSELSRLNDFAQNACLYLVDETSNVVPQRDERA